jgi:acylphosphatase
MVKKSLDNNISMAEEGNVKALFYIEPKEEHNRVQNIGCRMLITEKLIHAGFKKGRVFNLDDGRVEVLIEGKRSDIELFYNDVKEHLIEWLEARTKDKEKLRRMIGNPGIKFSELEYKDNLIVLDIGLYSHSLELGQLQKGVDAYYDLTEAIRELRVFLKSNTKP